MMCRQHPDDICHPPAKSCPKSHSHVIRTSSACRPHEISTGNIFPLKEQTALLMIKGISCKVICNSEYNSAKYEIVSNPQYSVCFL